MKKLIYISLLILLAGCSKSRSIVGTWYYYVSEELFYVTFNEDKTCYLKGQTEDVVCTYDGDYLYFKNDNGELKTEISVSSDYIVIRDEKLFDTEEKAKEYAEANSVIVPDVTGLSVTEASGVLLKNNLATGLTIYEDSDVEKGKVSRTSPEKGTKANKFSEVTIYISKGPDYVIIEDYTGQESEDVKNMLMEYGINVTIEYLPYEGKLYYSKKVVKQSVLPGERLENGDSIIIYIRR